MKRLIGYIFLIMCSYSYADSELEYNYPMALGHASDIKKMNEHKEFETDYNQLQLAKFYMLNGALDASKEVLLRIENTKSPIFEIRTRYLATIYFIKGNYKKVLETLSTPEMKFFFTHSKTCLLKIVSQIYLAENENLIKTWQRCESILESNSENGLLWVRAMVGLQLNKEQKKKILENINIENIEANELEVYLKLGIFLNQQDRFIPRFKFFSQGVLESQKLRELIGLSYYRNNNLTMAYEVLKDMTTSNAEIFKGNILLAKNENEQAYAQFKLALLKKSHSQNALERLVPIAWKLGQYKDGAHYVEKLKDFSKNDDLSYYTMMSVFLTLQHKDETVENYLKIARRQRNLVEPLEITQLSIINQHRTRKFKDIQIRYDHSCLLGDAIGCWFLLSHGSWESFHEFIGKNEKNKEEIRERSNLFETYTTQEIAHFQDDNMVDQKRIEDLDNQLIELLKTQ